jgi:hypothetical protein
MEEEELGAVERRGPGRVLLKLGRPIRGPVYVLKSFL